MIPALLATACSGGSGSSADDPAADEPSAATDGPTLVAPADAGALSESVEAWLAYERAPEYEVDTAEIDVPMRDDVTLGCTLRRPADADGPLDEERPGLVVEVTPYVAMADLHGAEAAFFTERGYVTIVCNVRGSGRSGGTWGHADWAQDGRDAHDVVEWLAAQPFSDGRVGQFGESYGGQTTYGSAVEQPPHLVAIAPMQAPGSLYHDVIYPGGIKSTEAGQIDSWPPIAQGITGGAVVPEEEFAANRAHPTFDQWWEDRSLAGRLDDIEVPVLAMGGYVDEYFRDGTLANIEGALDRTWAFYGPWEHRPPVALGAGIEVDDPLPSGVLLAWFDHWVMELPDVPVPEDPTFATYEGPVDVGRGWRQLDGWDPAGLDPVSWQLGADGALGPDAAAGDPAVFSEPSEPTDPHGSVVFTSAPLEDDRVLVGRASVELAATLSADEAHLYVELFDVAPDGTETLVDDGFLAASHRDSDVEPEPAPVDEEVTLTVDVRPAHHRFVVGHAVRVRISGGGSGRLTDPPAPVEISVATGASTLRLPGFGTPAGD